jgi:hypothetical protein
MKMRNALWPFIVASLFAGSPLLAKEKKPKLKLYTDTVENTKQTTQKTFSRQAPTQSPTTTDGGNASKAKGSK